MFDDHIMYRPDPNISLYTCIMWVAFSYARKFLSTCVKSQLRASVTLSLLLIGSFPVISCCFLKINIVKKAASCQWTNSD